MAKKALPAATPPVSVSKQSDFCIGRFDAMASPCEILIETRDEQLARTITLLAAVEARRIEHKFSRYRPDSVVSKINTAQGRPIPVDLETHRLLAFAETCFQLSEGMFDITSGILRNAWKFDGSDNVPNVRQIKPLLSKIGWQHTRLSDTTFTLPEGMEIDLGGIGKEYAVDKVADAIKSGYSGISVVVNFGGDIQVTERRKHDQPWMIGIENPAAAAGVTDTIVKIYQGGLATSGDARRYLLKHGKRYSHILNPFTGYPVISPPRSVTVAAENCTQAGLLATLAMLQGKHAAQFLAEQGLTHWIYN
ncbi:FAD:protein FMN transferase [Alteromonas sp. AMM-1]|uniref:FAD:protein FMN transferase n=1 Tax=Alteromonas sp. AMM-1 TaxID=3394233 RepID=UPI0039A5E3C1